MPGATMEQLLGVRHLTDLVQTFWNEPHQNVCLSKFEASSRKILPEGDTAEWDEVQAHRHLAPFTGHKSPFVHVQETDLINRQSTLAHVKLYKDLDAHRMLNMRMPGQLGADARAYVAQELKDLVQLSRRTMEFACSRVLHNNLNVTAATVPGSTISFSYVPGIQTQNRVANWSTAATAISSSEIPIFQDSYMQNAGMEAQQVIYNGTTERDIRANTEVQSFVREDSPGEFLSTGFVTNELFRKVRLGGMSWNKHVGGYVPQGGAFTRYVDDDRLIVMPGDDMLQDVLGWALGWGLVPTGPFARSGEGAAGLVARAPSRGVYSYAEVKTNPVGVRIYVGVPFLPVVIFPAGIMLFTTDI